MKKISLLTIIFMVTSICLCACGDKKEEIKNDEEIKVAETVKEENDIEKTEEKAEEPETAKEEKKEEKAEEKKEEAKKEETKAEEKATVSVDLNAVRNAVISGSGVSNPLMVETARLNALYGIDTSTVKQSASFVTMDGVFPSEAVMIEAIDEASANAIASALNNRLTEVKNQSESYDPENYQLAQQCTVNKNGCFVSMFLASDHAKMKSIYSSYVK